MKSSSFEVRANHGENVEKQIKTRDAIVAAARMLRQPDRGMLVAFKKVLERKSTRAMSA